MRPMSPEKNDQFPLQVERGFTPNNSLFAQFVRLRTGLSVETSPVTQARHIDIPVALTIIRILLPNLSTVNEQMMPPMIIQACKTSANLLSSAKCKSSKRSYLRGCCECTSFDRWKPKAIYVDRRRIIGDCVHTTKIGGYNELVSQTAWILYPTDLPSKL